MAKAEEDFEGLEEDDEPADDDFDAIRRRNKLMREQEKEMGFWEGMQNTNVGKGTGAEAGGKWRSGDKGKGGRTIGEQGGRGGGRGGGGGKGRGEGGKGGGGSGGGGEKGGEDMSKLEKRRKDANKAKVGNHDRKAAQRKKAAKGGF